MALCVVLCVCVCLSMRDFERNRIYVTIYMYPWLC